MIRGSPKLMDPRIFATGPMGLTDDLLTMPLEARFAYDAARNMFFLNMEGMSPVTEDEVEAIGTEVGRALPSRGVLRAGRLRVPAVPVTNQEPQRIHRGTEVHCQVPRLLGHP
jgi:hypothetical protein